MKPIHGIWTFLSDNTVCGKPIEYKNRADGWGENDLIPMNVAVELDDITCRECKQKLEVAHAS